MAEYDKQQRNQLSRAIANSEPRSRQLKVIIDNKNNNISISTFSGGIVQKKNEFGDAKYIVNEDQGCSRANKRGIVIYQKGVSGSNRVYHASRTDGKNIANDDIHEGRRRTSFYKDLTVQCIAMWDTVAVDKTFIWGDYTVIRLLPY